MEVIQVPDRPASRSFYTVAGRLLFIQTIDPRLGTLIEQLFAGWQLLPVSFPDKSPDITIECFRGDYQPQVPTHLDQFEIGGDNHCYTGPRDFYLTLAGALIQIENGPPVQARLYFQELPAAGDPLLASATSFAVCAALRRFGVFELHSAALVHPDSEKAVLIIGPSGSGKSTLALKLALSGWPYLSDDEVLLSLEDGEVEARGFRSFFAVHGAVAATFGVAPENQSASKTCFVPETVLPSGRRAKASPGVLLFAGLSGRQTTRLEKLRQADAMRHLIKACPWATFDTAVANANLAVLAQLAKQTTAFALHAGRDLLEPDYASALLRDLQTSPAVD